MDLHFLAFLDPGEIEKRSLLKQDLSNKKKESFKSDHLFKNYMWAYIKKKCIM